MSFQGGAVVKNVPTNLGDARDADLIPVSGKSLRVGNDNPRQYAFLENPHGQRNLEGYSPWSHKESDTTEHSTHTHTIHKLVVKIM